MKVVARRIWVVGGAMALLTGLLAWRVFRPRAATVFDTSRVARGKIVAKVTASGTLSALVTVQVGSQVSGRVSEISVDFNSPVTKGKVLARIDPSLFQAAVEQATANLSVAEGALEKAKAEAADARRVADRAQALRGDHLIAQAELDTAQTNAQATAAQVKAAEGQVAQAKAALHQARTNLDYCTIVSPIAGTVISRNVDVGQTVAAALSAPTLFTIAEDLRQMQVDTSVAEADVGKLQDGMEAGFFVDAYPSRVFHGKVRQIRNAATTVQNVVTYDAVIDVDNPDLALRPGMTATVTFVYAEKDGVLQVPNAALRFRAPAELLASAERRHPGAGAGADSDVEEGHLTLPDQRQVWVLEGKRPRPVLVKLGVSDGTSTEVVSGDLKEGQSVVVGMAVDPSAPSGRLPGSLRRVF